MTKRKMVIVGLIILTLSLWPAVGLAQTFLLTPRVGVGIEYWLSELTGEVQVAQGNITGTTIDLENDLGLNKNKGIPEISLWYPFAGGSRLTLSYLQAEYDGKNTLTKKITFHGTPYFVHTPVSTNLKTEMWELTDEIPLLEGTEGKRLGLLLGVKYLTFNIKLSSPTVSNSRTLEVPFPEVGLTGSMELSRNLSLNGQISAMSLKISAVGGTMVDARLGASYRLNENWSLSLLYRYFNIDGEADNDEANFNLEGPVFSVTGYF
jgi:hypothetical protein